MKHKTCLRRVLIVFFSIFISIPGSMAQENSDLINLNREGTTQATSAVEAAREIQSQVITDATRALVTEIIGEKRYQKNRGQVESRVVRQWAKFIPFVSAGTAAQQPDGSWKMTVEMRVSMASLRKMVLEAGLLNDAEGPASILPLVALTDRRKSMTLRWWMGSEKSEATKFLSQVESSFYERLQTEFSRQGFHMIKPLGNQSSPLPEVFRTERPGPSEWSQMAEFHGASMILSGDLRFRESRSSPGAVTVQAKLQVIQPASGRMVAEISRSFDTDPGAFESVVRSKLASEGQEIAKDLSTQVLEAWQRGTLNTNLLRLSIRGNLNPKQLNDFKTSLQSTVRDVKSLKERLFEPGMIQFEVDYAGDVSSLREKLKNLSLSAYETRLADANDKAITIDVKTK